MRRRRIPCSCLLVVTALAALAVAEASAGPPPDGVRPAEQTPAQRTQQMRQFYGLYRPLLAAQLATYRIAHPEDLYKFIYQGVMGPAHAVSEEGALSWLESEWQELPGPDQDPPAGSAAPLPLLEPLRPDSLLVRVHLVPLRDLVTSGLTGDAAAAAEAEARRLLAAAFAATAEAWQSQPGNLRQLWVNLSRDTGLWGDYLTVDQVLHFTQEMVMSRWPAVHHSDSYRERCLPHYRVVDPRLLPTAWREHDQTAASQAEDG